MKELIVALAFSMMASAVTAVPIQWTSASGGNDHWYDIETNLQNWDAARADATSRVWNGLQGYLVSITSAAENAFILNTFTPSAFGALWTGGTDAETEGTFVWADSPESTTPFYQNGRPTGYDQFVQGEPNDSLGAEDHVEIGFLGFYWNDRPGEQPWGYIVEFGGIQTSPVPLPAGGLLLLGALGVLAVRRKKS